MTARPHVPIEGVTANDANSEVANLTEDRGPLGESAASPGAAKRPAPQEPSSHKSSARQAATSPKQIRHVSSSVSSKTAGPERRDSHRRRSSVQTIWRWKPRENSDTVELVSDKNGRLYPVGYTRRPSSAAAPALVEGWQTHTAVHEPPGQLRPSRNVPLFSQFGRAISDIHNAFERYEREDVQEGAAFEYRLAAAREALPDDMAQALSDEASVEAPAAGVSGVQRAPSRQSTQRRQSVRIIDAEEGHDPYLVTFQSTKSPQDNPRQWSYRRRMCMLLVYAPFSLIGPYASSMASPASSTIGEELGLSTAFQQSFIVGLFLLAFCVGPLFSGPASESFGRRPVVLVCGLCFFVFNIGCAVAKTSTQMLALRFFAGMFSGAAIPMGGGAVSDMFELHERGSAMAVYTIVPLLGPAISPVIGGWILQGWGRQHWRFIFWVSNMLTALILITGLLLLKETYAPRILQIKAKRLRHETKDERYHTAFEMKSETLAQKAQRTLLRPVIFLTTEVLVFLPSLYLAIIYSCFYLCIVSVPRVFGSMYHYQIGIASLHNLALGLGSILFGQVAGQFIDRVYRRLCKKHGDRRPEYKLPLLAITVFVLPLSMLLYGWTAEYKKVWIAPDIGMFMIGASVICCILQVQLYMADLMTIYAASALSATMSSRSLMAFIFLLFNNALFDNLGMGWGVSVLALITAVVGIPAPFLLYKYGPELRQRSKYAVKD